MTSKTSSPENRQQVDTIVAVATPPGKGAIGIVRLSGPNSFTIASKIVGGLVNKERGMKVADFHDSKGDKLDRGLLLVFPGPNSFSGEDMVEFHSHGNPLIMDGVIASAIEAGARRAEAGEFSRRAYTNGKIDLTQAESIADIINSNTEVALRAAMKSLSGEFSERVHHLGEMIMKLRVYIEATLDFPTDEIDLLQDKECARRTDEVIKELAELISQTRQGSLLSSDINLAIIGKPNAGKSSLLNSLCRTERAIVSSEAGTTRDFLQEAVNIRGMSVLLTDTAGIHDAASEVEKAGIERSWQQAEISDVIVLIFDVNEEIGEEAELGAGSDFGLRSFSIITTNEILSELTQRNLLDKTIVLANKVDLLDDEQRGKLDEDIIGMRMAAVDLAKQGADAKPTQMMPLSVKEGEGMKELLDGIAEKCGREEVAPLFTARARHLEALQKTQAAVQQGYGQLKQSGVGELFAEDLKQANAFLDEILGETTTDDLLDRIFAGFCIGK